VDDFPLGRLSKTAHFGRKSRLAFLDIAHRGEPISVTDESPFVQRSGALAGHLAEIKRAGCFAYKNGALFRRALDTDLPWPLH